MANMEKQEAGIIILSDDDDEQANKGGKFQRGEENKEDTIVILSDDDYDDKANEVLSLGIVGKPLQLQAAAVAGDSKNVKKEEIADIVQSEDKDLVCDNENEDLSLKIVVESIQLHSATGKTVQIQIEKPGDSLKGNNDSSVMDGKRSSKTDVAGAAKEEVDKIVQSVKTDLNGVQMIADNLVMRKLLRGPRYFDPQDSGSWETCSTKRKKPCFVCGSSEHGFKECQKTQECYICKKKGHRARKCPEKHKNDPQNDKLCLKCLSSGHDMSSCSYSYSLDDLKEIQCYVCKSFGHLCCANFVNTSSRPLSCYRCGELGHIGLACSGLRKEDSTLLSPGSCYKFGEGAHISREGKAAKKKRKRTETKQKRAAKKLRRETTDKPSPGSQKLGGLGARQCSTSVQAASKKIRKENKKQLKSSFAPRDHGKSQISRQMANPGHLGYVNIHGRPPADHNRYNGVPSGIPPVWASGQHHNNFRVTPPGHHINNLYETPSGQHLNYFRPTPSGQHLINFLATPSGQLLNNFLATPSGQHLNNFHVTTPAPQHTNFRWSRATATASMPMVHAGDHSRYDFVPPGISSVWTLDASRQNHNNFPAAPPEPQYNSFQWSRAMPSGQHHNIFSGGSHVSSSASSHIGFSALRFPTPRYGNSFGH